MMPVIALVGRPNVGKSTLFNRLTRTRNALVADYAGLTRDRQYSEAWMQGRRFIVIDTGGIGDESGRDGGDIESLMAGQSFQAIDEADAVLLLVDCRDGLTAADIAIARRLRVKGKPAWLVANKIDGLNHELAVAPFYELGLGTLFPITATHGRGVASLMQQVLETFPPPAEDPRPAPAPGIKIAIVGRPNVGKSTLVNRMLGENRVVVCDLPGTTRDSVYVNYERAGQTYTLIDTAGIRRRKNIRQSVEKFSIVKTLRAIDDANVVILLLDASEGLVDQDLHLMGHVIDAGRALVIALNKWDGLDSDHKHAVKSELERRLRFVDFARIHFISALHGTGVGDLYSSVERAYHSATDKLTTHHLTRILRDAVSDHPPPMVQGRRVKLRYAHPGGHNPPVIVIHGNQTESVPGHYSRYLEKTFRRALELRGTPIRIEFVTGDNPFAGRKNPLTPRQQAKKRRLMRHAKKK